MAKIIHKQLSYNVRGTLFDVYNELGPMLPEKFYPDAICIGLETKGIACETEKQFSITRKLQKHQLEISIVRKEPLK